jgi:hypothetical protein
MRVRNNWNIVLGLAACGFCTSSTAQSAHGVTAGELIVEPPTLISLGFEWYIEGDTDRDAAVAVAYRRAGEREWHESLPLLRVQNERTFYVDTLYYTAPNMFAGSVFELAENTEYEVRFTLTDPDGASGETQRAVNVRTRAEPQPYAGGNNYRNALGGDWSRAAPPRVQPGDTILVHAGVYKDFDRFSYSHEIRSQYRTCCGTPWDGTFYLTQDGTAERPIAIKAAGDGEVIFDGDGNNVLFNVMGADHTYFEGITFRNTNLAIEAGQKGIAGAMGLSVKHSTFDQVGVAVHSDWSGSKNFYIADNVMNGRNDPTYLIGWFSIWPWNEQPNFLDRQRMQSYYAVAVYGSGHVVAYNRVTNFHDGIDHATYGMPDGYPNTPRDRMPVSNDIYGNDVSNMHDNCFETDGGMHNQRVFRNRCFNAAVGAMSPQPIFGGPVYFIRNVVYNSVYGPLKIQADPSGILVFQNTYVGEIQQITPASNIHFRNNLILGQKARPALLAIDTHTPWSSSDYNGFHMNADAEFSFQWNSPPAGGPVDYTSPREVRRFKTLAEYQRATGQDAHSREVDYSVFVNVVPPDFTNPTKLVSPEEVDLRLRPRSRAVDGGTVLPGLTDGFTGRAPDLGAYEQGVDPPHYGPRATGRPLTGP